MTTTVICEKTECLNFGIPIIFEEQADMYVCGVCMNQITNVQAQG